MATEATEAHDPLDLQPTLLMGPGPSPVHPSVLQAMATPTIGHLDPRFLAIMDGTVRMLQAVFGSTSPLTIPISGTGTAGMEASLANLLAPGDRAVVVRAGYFGERMAEMARRLGAEVETVDVPWGRAADPADVETAVKRGRPPKLLAVVHVETSTGVLQPLEGLAEVAHRHGALMVVDAVTSLGGIPVEVDAREIDLCYSGTQKCLSCPPGLAPLTVRPQAEQAIRRRRGPVVSWYLDLTLLGRYWGQERFYHHTAPINLLFGLHRALQRVLAEGLEARYERHRRVAAGLQVGLECLGLHLMVEEPALRAPSLTAVQVPDGVNEAAVRGRLLAQFGIEIGGGLGAWKGRVWRIGTMGEAARVRCVAALLAALGAVLADAGYRASSPREAVEACLQATAGPP